MECLAAGSFSIVVNPPCTTHAKFNNKQYVSKLIPIVDKAQIAELRILDDLRKIENSDDLFCLYANYSITENKILYYHGLHNHFARTLSSDQIRHNNVLNLIFPKGYTFRDVKDSVLHLNDFWRILRKILTATTTLLRHNLCPIDLKIDNMLLFKKNIDGPVEWYNLTPKLIDFSAEHVLSSDRTLSDYVFDFKRERASYMAWTPEMMIILDHAATNSKLEKSIQKWLRQNQYSKRHVKHMKNGIMDMISAKNKFDFKIFERLCVFKIGVAFHLLLQLVAIDSDLASSQTAQRLLAKMSGIVPQDRPTIDEILESCDLPSKSVS